MLNKIDEMLKLGGAIEFGEDKITHSNGRYRRWNVYYFIGELIEEEVESFDNLEDAINSIY